VRGDRGDTRCETLILGVRAVWRGGGDRCDVGRRQRSKGMLRDGYTTVLSKDGVGGLAQGFTAIKVSMLVSSWSVGEQHKQEEFRSEVCSLRGLKSGAKRKSCAKLCWVIWGGEG